MSSRAESSENSLAKAAFVLPDTGAGPWWPAFVALGIIAAVHTITTWGYLGLSWGDAARWMHEIDRGAHGETVYRDFYWPFPPLAMWLLGGVGRVIGSDLPQLWTMTTCIFVLAMTTWFAVMLRLVERELLLLATVCGSMLGIAYAQNQSIALPLGMYTPAAPLGFLCLLATLLCFLRTVSHRDVRSAVLAGAFGGLCLLAKHDVWIPGAYLTAATALIAIAGDAESQRERAIRVVAPFAAYALVAGTGIAILVHQSGWNVLIGVVTGFGMVREFGGRGAPTVEGLVVDLAMLFALGALLAGAIAIATRASADASAIRRSMVRWMVTLGAIALALALIWVFRAWQIGVAGRSITPGALSTPLQDMMSGGNPSDVALLKRAVLGWRDRALLHLFPLALPVTVLAVLLVRRRQIANPAAGTLALVLLGLCIAMRARRAFEFTEWTNYLIELPVYLFVARQLVPRWNAERRSTLRVVLATLVLAAALAQWTLGSGPLSRRGSAPMFATKRGAVHLGAGQAKTLEEVEQAVDAIDSTGSRPLFSFGYSGSFNYLLRRPAASPLTHGFLLSTISDPERAVALLDGSHDSLIIIDNPFWRDPVPLLGFDLLRWERAMRENHYWRFDRSYFDRVKAGCLERGRVGRAPADFVIFDCAPHT